MSLQLIGLAGGAGVGKDYVANNYIHQYGFLPAALADEFKIRVVASGKATFEEVFFTKPPHVRALLQQEGTERGRDLYGEDFWCNLLHAKLLTLQMRWGDDYSRFVVPDVRYPNEVEFIHRLGGKVFQIVAPDRYANNGLSEEARQHRSETSLQGRDDLMDAVIHNDYDDATTLPSQTLDLMTKHGFFNPLAGVRIGVARPNELRPYDGELSPTLMYSRN